MSLNLYYEAMGKYPLLSPEKEFEVAKAAKNGDYKSRDLLINSNLRLVVNISKKYARDGNLEDLIQQGNLGLIEAVKKFDPDRGFRFSTCAHWWIKRSIFSYFSEVENIKLPINDRSLRSKIYGFISDYVSEYGHQPNEDIIAKGLNSMQEKKVYSRNDVEKLLQTYERILVSSLNAKINSDSTTEKIDFIAGVDGRDVVDDIYDKDFLSRVYTLVDNLDLDKKSRQVLNMKFYDGMSFTDISNTLDIPRERIKQNYNLSLRTLRSHLSESGLMGDYEFN
jgi:RNA polymerase sigma factor (sigma-70 family)